MVGVESVEEDEVGRERRDERRVSGRRRGEEGENREM